MTTTFKITEEHIGNDATEDDANAVLEYLNAHLDELDYIDEEGFPIGRPDAEWRYGDSGTTETVQIAQHSWDAALSAVFNA